MTRVWIAQCLCPQRHAILTSAGEAADRDEAEDDIEQPLRGRIAVVRVRKPAATGLGPAYP
jgi:hypothetical protein